MTERGFDKYRWCGAYHWDALAPSFRTHNAITAARYRTVLSVCGALGARRVLDVGCGDAKLDAMLAEAGARFVFGVDNERSGIAAGLTRLTRETDGEVRERIVLGCGDGFRLPVRSACVDIVVMTDIIEHLLNPHEFLKEAARTLRDDGVLVVTTPYRATEVPLDENHVHEYYPGELESLMRTQFKEVSILLSDPLWIVQLYTMGGWLRPFRWLVNALSIIAKRNVFLTWPVGRYAGQITAIARRPSR